MVAVVPFIFLFLATADWKNRWGSARPLALSAATLVLAFEALYYRVKPPGTPGDENELESGRPAS